LAIGITGSGTAQFRMIDEQPMEFFTNDIRRMIINKDNGYVGIGAFSPLSPPAFQLDVVGDVNIGPATAGYFINTQEVLKYHGVAGNYSETNIYVGVAAGVLATTGVHNTYVGYKAGNKNEFETDNTFIGFCSGMNTCSGQGNTFLGSMTGMSNDTGEGNVFIGVLAGQANIEADYNTFVGNVSGHDNTMGYSNSFYGKHSGYSNTTGNFNCYLGTYSGAEAATDNNWNTCVGSRSGVQCEGNYNVMSGSNAGAMSHGNNNVFSGTFAGFNSQRHYNVISGQGAGYNNNGDGNVILGAYKGYTTIGNKNCFIGVDDALGLGSYFYSHGDFNICLGADARNTSTDINILDNSIVIGYDAVVTNSNSMILGNNKVNVGIGLSGESDGPQSKLEINADDDGVSGLQFRRLTTATDPGGNPGDGVLAVDIDGKVIYVEQSAGVAGPTGATGDAGVAGPTGAAGIDGLPGVTGPQGVAGLPGATGVAGATGIAGVAGATGATGTPGASEADNGLQVSTGDYCTPTPHVELGGELHKDTEVKLYHNLWGSHNLFFTGQAATNTIGDYQHRNVAVGNYWGERLSAKFNVRQRSGVPTWGSIAVNVLNDYSGLIKDTEAIGVNSETSGNNSYSGLNFGVKAKAKNGMRNYAVWAQVYQSSGLSLANYAIWGQAANPHLLPGAAITNWAGWFVGNLNVTGSTYHLSSDIKLKDSISNITGALELLKKIHPKTFKFKTDDYSYMSLPGGLQYGVIANEVDTVIPSLVGNLIFPEQIDSAGNIINPELEYKGMNYIGLIPILTQGIKELDSLVTDLASPPPAPMLASPADGSTDLPTNLIFNWHPSSR
ncbi:MAG: tail fiber domain-containing protein, partial [Bacteroidetes bacterium]|nr:tail fiber domain-containing protein [Bacteroidota bacterium]